MRASAEDDELTMLWAGSLVLPLLALWATSALSHPGYARSFAVPFRRACRPIAPPSTQGAGGPCSSAGSSTVTRCPARAACPWPSSTPSSGERSGARSAGPSGAASRFACGGRARPRRSGWGQSTSTRRSSTWRPCPAWRSVGAEFREIKAAHEDVSTHAQGAGHTNCREGGGPRSRHRKPGFYGHGRPSEAAASEAFNTSRSGRPGQGVKSWAA